MGNVDEDACRKPEEFGFVMETAKIQQAYDEFAGKIFCDPPARQVWLSNESWETIKAVLSERVITAPFVIRDTAEQFQALADNPVMPGNVACLDRVVTDEEILAVAASVGLKVRTGRGAIAFARALLEGK